MPNILFYTVAVGAPYRKMLAVTRSQSVIKNELVLDERQHNLSLTTNPSLACNLMRSQIGDFADINQYDAVCFIEPDIVVKDIACFKGDKILVEHGDRTFEAMVPSENHIGIPHIPKNVLVPWGGVVYVPKPHYSFLEKWREEHGKMRLHMMEELCLYHALKGYPWERLDNTVFWPNQGDIIHYRWSAAKFHLCPELYQGTVGCNLPASNL